MEQQQHGSLYTDDASLSSSSSLSYTTTTYSFTSRSSSTASTSTTPPDPHVYNHRPRRQRCPLQEILLHGLIVVAIAFIVAIAITCLFVLFLVIQILSDLLPRRMWTSVVRRFKAVNWPDTMIRWGIRLARLFEWEKNRRASFYPSLSQRFAHMDGTHLHRVLRSITLVLNSINKM
ncbi:hypothetical protein O0I10_005780 [Lichtheimia ornata]|uniref:Transmembrane protein n=1 Tax=Lichtheimia ornata TaxID=688661 RepID=A0AAD7V5C8_9FUNG|nr:uncharacterized protein O0I10_005780 [Lichtheimia ornata]KAJ8658427.1 hypothetical protein O0I10_005780 [Lichtheimia ornata]